MEKAGDFRGRRAEILAQLFLEDMGALVWKSQGDIGPFDSIAVFRTADKKCRLIAIEVKSTDRPVDKEFRFQARADSIRALCHSNVPVLFLVVDVKRNEFFYGWASDVRISDVAPKTGAAQVRCILPVEPAKDAKQELLDAISSQPDYSEQAAGS